MYIIDLTTSGNYFGRITGIARVEMQVAIQFAQNFPNDTVFTYWNSIENSFEIYEGDLDYKVIKGTKKSGENSHSIRNYLHRGFSDFNLDKNDSFVITGNAWSQSLEYTQGCIAFANKYGLKAMFYIHDLIPIKFPYYYEKSYVEAFRASMELIAASGAILVCNSKNTQQDLMSWCREAGIGAPRSAIAYLGDSIQVPASKTNAAETGPAETSADAVEGGRTEAHYGDDNYVLTVGAIHRRKNHALLLAVWRRLHAKLGKKCPKLKIVGGVAQDGKALHAEILHDPTLRDSIEVLWRVSDVELDALYRNARLVVYPSLYEGWGLPVAEALTYGKVCLASNVSAIPEIADLGADLLDTDDPISWASRILFYCQNHAVRKAREDELRNIYKPRSWRDTVEQIVDALDAHSMPQAPTIFPGETVEFNEAHSAHFLASHTYLPEPWGRGCMDSALKIRFSLRPAEQTDLIAILRLRASTQANGIFTLNGEPLEHKALCVGLHQYHIEMRSDLLCDENNLEFHTVGTALLDDGQDAQQPKRYTAFGVSQFQVMTKPQLDYSLQDRGIDPRVLHEIRLTEDHADLILCGEVSESGVRTQEGLVSLSFANTMPHLGRDVKAVAYFDLSWRQKSFLTIRVNGNVLSQHNLEADTLKQACVHFDLPNDAMELRYVEFFLLDDSTAREQDAVLTHLFLPQTLLATPPSFSEGQNIKQGEFLKFGERDKDIHYDILCAGWNRSERFGVSCESAGTVSLKVEATTPIEQIKLNCKLVGETQGVVIFWLNGIPNERAISTEVEAQIFDLPEPLWHTDALSIQVSVNGLSRFVLRSLQLL